MNLMTTAIAPSSDIGDGDDKKVSKDAKDGEG
jgi:hypothetical protein